MQIEHMAFYPCGALTSMKHGYGKNQKNGTSQVGK